MCSVLHELCRVLCHDFLEKMGKNFFQKDRNTFISINVSSTFNQFLKSLPRPFPKTYYCIVAGGSSQTSDRYLSVHIRPQAENDFVRKIILCRKYGLFLNMLLGLSFLFVILCKGLRLAEPHRHTP